MISNAVADWFLHNSLPLGGPGKVVEIDIDKFGKRKFNKGSYRKEMWVLDGVDQETGQCFLVPCPENARDANVLLPIIQHWVLTIGEPTTAFHPMVILIIVLTTTFSLWVLLLVCTQLSKRDLSTT